MVDTVVWQQKTQIKIKSRNVAEYCWIVLLPILSSDKARARLDVRAEPYSKLHVQPYSAKSLFPRERAEPYSAMDDSNVKSGARHRMTLEKGTVLPNRTRRHPDIFEWFLVVRMALQENAFEEFLIVRMDVQKTFLKGC